MEITALILILLTTIIASYVILREIKSHKGNEDKQSLLMLQSQLQELSRAVDNKLGENSRLIQSQFSDSNKLTRDITERLTKIDEAGRRMVDFGSQLQDLQNILKNPKSRGILGEYYLETILKNVLPPGSFQMQYKFKNEKIVDAAVFYQEKIVPIDSKFSLENYNRLNSENDPVRRGDLERTFKNDLKNRIEETAKYVLPEEGTTGFAFMFIPHEAIYYDLLVSGVGAMKINTQDLIEYAYSKKVIIVSPTTFLAYLQTVLQGMQDEKLRQNLQAVISNVDMLGKHLGAYEEYFKKIGNHLGTTVNAYEAAGKEFKKIDKDVHRITGEKNNLGQEIPSLEKPSTEDL
jgi:DNA recombination protein RmuC